MHKPLINTSQHNFYFLFKDSEVTLQALHNYFNIKALKLQFYQRQDSPLKKPLVSLRYYSEEYICDLSLGPPAYSACG